MLTSILSAFFFFLLESGWNTRLFVGWLDGCLVGWLIGWLVDLGIFLYGYKEHTVCALH